MTKQHHDRSPGKFIVLEGPDGAGKSTQLRLLAEYLKQQGFQVTQCADPGSTAVGREIRKILLQKKTIRLDVRCEMLLFMSARAQMVKETIQPALERGEIVLGDRFTLSTTVYQGYAGSLEQEQVQQVAEIATAGLKPDLYLILDLSVEKLRQRMDGQPDRMEMRSDQYFEKVVEGYREMGKRDRHVLIDATQSVEQIHQEMVRHLTRVLKQA